MATDLLATVDENGCFTRLNRAWEQVLGWSLEELVGRPAMELIHPDDLERTLEVGGWAQGEINPFENRYLCKDGSWRSLVWTAHKDGDVWYAAARDVTERETLERHALHDSLTGLPNRLLFSDRTQQALARLERKDAPLALLWVDLDRLKLVNDGFGHELGDRLLRAVADRLREELREADTIARFGGDEFAVLVEDLVDETAALRVGDRIVAALSKSFAIEGEEISDRRQRRHHVHSR